MQLVNTETIPGWNITEVKGLVSGNTIRAKHLGRDIGAAFKNMAGGELKAYTELLAESRAEATSRMVAEAQALGAS
ncbi:MAG: YbjQ family protein, partial [Actinobacteria bacterium]|nr:YbjQ family protein [Actinomycetota bacterium]